MVDIPVEQVKNTFDANVFGALRTARAAIPHMAKRGSGVIVNVGSIVGDMYVTSLLFPREAALMSSPLPLLSIHTPHVRQKLPICLKMQPDALEWDILRFEGGSSLDHRGSPDGVQAAEHIRCPTRSGIREVEPREQPLQDLLSTGGHTIWRLFKPDHPADAHQPGQWEYADG